jgi:hypothetical protein
MVFKIMQFEVRFVKLFRSHVTIDVNHIDTRATRFYSRPWQVIDK